MSTNYRPIPPAQKSVVIEQKLGETRHQPQIQSRWNGKTVSIQVARTVLKTGAVILACFLSPIIAAASIPYIIAKSVSDSVRSKNHYQDRTKSFDSPSTPPPKDVPSALKKQAEFCVKQQDAEKDKTFQYKNAPSNSENWTATVEEKEISGMPIGIASAQGRRSNMEDAHLAIEFQVQIGHRTFPVQLFGVFDGHGGDQAANYVKDHLQQKLSEALVEFNPNGLTDEGIWNALKETMKRLDSDFKKVRPIGENGVGTTATIAMILDDKLWTANVGDSRTILENAGMAQQLTEDAKPDNEHYKKGIEKREGKIFLSTHPDFPSRVGSLSTARAIGQYEVKDQVRGRIMTRDTAKGVIPNPKITMKPLSDIALDSHLILCCDGIFDVASTRQVVGGVHSNRALTPKEHAENIIYSAYEANSRDNLSALVVKLKQSSDLDIVFLLGDIAFYNAGFIRHIQNGGDYETLEKYGEDLISAHKEKIGADYNEETDEYVKNIKRNLATAKELARIEHNSPRNVGSSDCSFLSDHYYKNLLEADITKTHPAEMKYIENVILTTEGNQVKLPDMGFVRYILNGGDFEQLLQTATDMVSSYRGTDPDVYMSNIIRNLQLAKLAKMEACCRRHAGDPIKYSEEQKNQDINNLENRFSEYKENLMLLAS